MRTWYRNVDYLTLLVWTLLVGIGLVAIYSTTHGPAAENMLESVRHNFTRQFVWAGICLVGIGIALVLPVRFYRHAAYPIYGLTIALLVAALLFGREVNGARSWIVVGSVSLQAAELAKVGTVLAVAQLLSSQRVGTMGDVRYAMRAVGLILLPAVLIIMQNDMGTALVFFGLVPVMLFWSGIPIPVVVLMISPAIAGYLALVYMPAALAFAILFTVGLWWYTRERYKIGRAHV